MDYPLENLGPERFQKVCQALIAKEHRRAQCFPVGQPDGGRDAITLFTEADSDNFVVFQVKFSRLPLAVQNPHEWLKEIVKAEAPKIANLIPTGATHYILMTNVPGTAHREAGSIDIVQTLLNDNFAIPSQCLWRDDINSRLHDAWDIKWAFPDILTGPDIIRYTIEYGLTEDKERRTLAIKSFVRDQFRRDAEVRFRQVELQDQLLDLFIDVPVKLRPSIVRKSTARKLTATFFSIAQEEPGRPPSGSEITEGAATLLLHPAGQEAFTRTVIEGAPGHGKSTIVQYICQVHRHRILNVGVDDPRIPNRHRGAPVRLPFKVDCRDLSLWLNRKNPFLPDEGAEVPADWEKSLESFLAAQVRHSSGGSSFSVSDLQAVAKLSALLLVCDGLDEVADIARRREVVEHISRGVNRLQEIAASMQTIVTSRPAAFANSPGLPEDAFTYLHLLSITRALIDEYATKWLRVRKLEGKEASDVRRILRDKLDQPHLRELARNPMQLTILLSLIQTRGGSLPEKRTALYDSYVELFFNRESEKSSVVRDHRDLLVDIHRYLGWVLHAESQTKQNRGSISTARLRQLVSEYLATEGHDSAIAQELFSGVVERVVALVSRVEGTYEFEVQPLREYFAARHLYNTAPYSPPGQETRGTLPERFDALCRDFFWLNVTRFYAGCYSKGELPSLVDRIEELARSDGYKDTSHPQSLAATLLSDWVFAQHPRSMKQVVDLIVNGLGLRWLASRGRGYQREEPLVLPKKSGNEELVTRCFDLLATQQPADYSRLLIELIRANVSTGELINKWLAAVTSATQDRRTQWIKHGLYLGALSLLDDSKLEAILNDDCDTTRRLDLIRRAGRHGFIESNLEWFSAVVDRILSRSPESSSRRGGSLLDGFITALSPARYTVAFQSAHPTPLVNLWQHVFGRADESQPGGAGSRVPDFEVARKCATFLGHATELAQLSAFAWATQIRPWNDLVERGRDLFSDRWALRVLAVNGAGIRSKVETCDDCPDLHDAGKPLCRRTRYARMRAGVPSWWQSQLAPIDEPEELTFTLLVLLAWAGPSVFERHTQLIDAKLRSLTTDQWRCLIRALRTSIAWPGQSRRDINVTLDALPSSLSERVVVVLDTRVNRRIADRLFERHLASYEGSDPWVLEFCQRSALRAAQQNRDTWLKWLPVISRSYMTGAIADPYFAYSFARAVREDRMPHDVSQEIVRHCDCYPIELVALAEQTCREHVAEQVVPVGIVAAENSWF